MVSSYPRRVSLRGFERVVTMVDGVSMKIVHSMLVTGDAETLLRLLPAALMRTFNTHPRMRALQVKNPDFTAEIQAPLTLNDITSKNLLRTRHFTDNSFDKWQSYAKQECNVAFDRFTQFPFYLTVWRDAKVEQIRLMLFSDHYMSDGRSGMVVLDCILTHVAQLAQHEDLSPTSQVNEFPLRPSLYEMWLYPNLLTKIVVEGLVAFFGTWIYHSIMATFKPVLPAREDQHDFVAPPVENPTGGSMTQGDPLCMRQALAMCKDEKVTFGGALIAAIVLAVYQAARDQTGPFKLFADVDYDMRQRVPYPAKEEQVGAYISICGLEWLAKEGVDIKTTRFWDLARRAKSEIDANLQYTVPMAAPYVFLDQNVHSKMDPSFPKVLKAPNSQTSDANISNIGRYPHTREFVLNERGLKVESLHVYNSIPHLGPSVCFFLTSVDSFCYSMAHKCEDDTAESVFAAWIAICEEIGKD